MTGATGFVGAHLTELLIRQGEQVAILCRASSDAERLRDVLPHVTRITGDLLYLQAVADSIRAFAPDVVFHLAWHGVGNSHRNDEEQVDKNFYSSLALLRLAREIGCRAWIGLGSQAEYGPQNRIVDENAGTNPTTLYGTTKLCTCLLAQQLAAAAPGLRFAWLRLFSAYGPKDNPDWMIPYLIQTLRRGEKPALTRGDQRWDYVYVEDAAEAIYQTALTPDAEGVFNLGSGEAYPLRQIVTMIRDVINPELPIGFGEVPYRPDQVMHLQADVTKLRRMTGWIPRTRLSDGIEKTIAWYANTGAKDNRIE